MGEEGVYGSEARRRGEVDMYDLGTVSLQRGCIFICTNTLTTFLPDYAPAMVVFHFCLPSRHIDCTNIFTGGFCS